MKRSSQTEKKVFNSANGFEKRPAAKKNCADYGFCAAQIFIAQPYHFCSERNSAGTFAKTCLSAS